MSTTKCRSAVAPALQAAPSLLSSVDSQIARRQRVALATMAWDILSSDFAAIDIAEADDRRTISAKHAPATICRVLHRVATDRTGRPFRGSGESCGCLVSTFQSHSPRLKALSASAIPLPMPREAPVIKARFVTSGMLSLLDRAIEANR